MRFLEHSSDSFAQGAVETLRDAILVWLIAHSVLALNACTSKEGAHRFAHVLPALVIAKGLDLQASLVRWNEAADGGGRPESTVGTL